MILNTTSELHDVLTWNDATITGILIVCLITSAWVVRFLFKTNQEILKKSSEERETLYKEFTAERDRLYKEHLNEIKSFNEMLIKINNQYSDSIRSLVQLNK